MRIWYIEPTANPYPMLRGLDNPIMPFAGVRRQVRRGALAGLGAANVSATQVAKTAATSAAGAYVGAASSAALYAEVGSAAGPIGTAVGAIVGLVAGSLLSKNYLNVANVNAGEAQDLQIFNQYKAIQGQAPGRQFGLPAMRAIWKGALFAGLFPKNNTKLCYHDGCLTYLGQPSEIDDVLDKSCSDKNCFADVYPAFLAARAGTSQKLAVRSPIVTPAAAIAAKAPVAHGVLKGLGALGVVAKSAMPAPASPDAVVFIDHFFLPANAPGSPCTGGAGCYWVYPETSLAHQVLYDVADAWLATKSITTTPYIAAKPVAVPPPAKLVPAASSVTPNTVAVAPVAPLAAPVVTLPPSIPAATAASAAYATSVTQAASANLDAALAAQGFTRTGTTPAGIPIYADPSGNTWVYQNGQMFPYGTVAQLASTGSAGSGIATPTSGLDPGTLAIIQGSLAQGLTPAQAVQNAENSLMSQGVPVTPDVVSQLQAAAESPVGAPGAPVVTAIPSWVLIGGGVLLLLAVLK